MAEAAPLGVGNSVALSPDQSMVVATGSNGTISAFYASSGEQAWSYTPMMEGQVLSTSGATFGYRQGVMEYIVYTVNEGSDSPNWYVMRT